MKSGTVRAIQPVEEKTLWRDLVGAFLMGGFKRAGEAVLTRTRGNGF